MDKKKLVEPMLRALKGEPEPADTRTMQEKMDDAIFYGNEYGAAEKMLARIGYLLQRVHAGEFASTSRDFGRGVSFITELIEKAINGDEIPEQTTDTDE